MTTRTTRWALACAAGLVAATTLVPAQAARPAGGNSEIEAQFRLERDKCMSGRSHQDRATCLREAYAARAEARAGRLDNGADTRALRENALARCKRQPAADRRDCERLALGEGTQEGSVAEGAIVKEIVTREVGTPS